MVYQYMPKIFHDLHKNPQPLPSYILNVRSLSIPEADFENSNAYWKNMYFTFLDMIHLVRTQNFSEILHFLPLVHTHHVYVSGGKKY